MAAYIVLKSNSPHLPHEVLEKKSTHYISRCFYDAKTADLSIIFQNIILLQNSVNVILAYNPDVGKDYSYPFNRMYVPGNMVRTENTGIIKTVIWG